MQKRFEIFLALMDLKFEISKLEEEYTQTTSVAIRHKIMRRIKVLLALCMVIIRPEWMILTVLAGITT